jgi:hypothetical protein
MMIINLEEIIVKWNSSSTPELHNLHILSSAGVFKYLPFSIFKLLLLILILTNVYIDFVFNDLDICKMCILGVNKLHSLNQSSKQD